ncbi:transferrin-binding protein-like solute binding protein [Roseobacter sp. CCS2]|uniref:transferrin-binding protein-like solute binding protein n=1 Tax=Roseobacter sp. CCS2 TaxID=391593 RepID=UPI0012EAC4D6|nr:transferrin-binding protein-like solute binding protein [Roseobacter sp. CCS2]
MLILIACGGGGGGGDGDNPGGGGPDITPNPDLVYADDQPVTRESVIGKTFPIQLVVGSARDGGIPRRETASIEYVTADKAIITYNGTSTEFNYRNALSQENWTSGASNSGGGLLQDLRLDRVTKAARGIAIGNSSIANPDLPLAEGVFGFVTPENRLTGSVNYSSDFGSRMLITATDWVEQDDGSFDRVERVVETGGETVSISADFSTGIVSGTLFDGSYSTIDDRQNGNSSVTHDVTVTLENAVVDGSGFTGDINVMTTASSNLREEINGGVGPQGDILPSTVVMNSQDAEGTFFGYDAQGVGGTFEANFDETFYRGENPFDGVDAEEVTENRTIVGDFLVNN